MPRGESLYCACRSERSFCWKSGLWFDSVGSPDLDDVTGFLFRAPQLSWTSGAPRAALGSGCRTQTSAWEIRLLPVLEAGRPGARRQQGGSFSGPSSGRADGRLLVALSSPCACLCPDLFLQGHRARWICFPPPPQSPHFNLNHLSKDPFPNPGTPWCWGSGLACVCLGDTIQPATGPAAVQCGTRAGWALSPWVCIRSGAPMSSCLLGPGCGLSCTRSFPVPTLRPRVPLHPARGLFQRC